MTSITFTPKSDIVSVVCEFVEAMQVENVTGDVMDVKTAEFLKSTLRGFDETDLCFIRLAVLAGEWNVARQVKGALRLLSVKKVGDVE